MAKAKYTVMIPNDAPNVAVAAHHFLSYGPARIDAATVQHGIPNDSLVVYAEESPEMDSQMKQLAVFVGEIANAQAITVVKEGKSIATWTMRNPHYAPQPTVPTQQPVMSPGEAGIPGQPASLPSAQVPQPSAVASPAA